MKRLTVFLFAVCCTVLASCATAGNTELSDACCFVCSENDAPVPGYRFYAGDLCVAVTNRNGFAMIPAEYLGGEMLSARKSGWETLCIQTGCISDEGVLCVIARSFPELCDECSQLIASGDLERAERCLGLIDSSGLSDPEKDSFLALTSVIAYKRGDFPAAYEAAGKICGKGEALSAFSRYLYGEVLYD